MAIREEVIEVVLNKMSYQPSQANIRCNNCGDMGHKAKSPECRALNRSCRNCQKPHNFSHMGRSNPSPARGQGRGLGRGRGSVHQVHYEDQDWQEAQPVEAQTRVFTISSSKTGQFKTIELLLDSTSIEFLVDIGAKVSILNEETCTKYFYDYELHEPETALFTYNSTKIPTLGVIYITVTYAGITKHNCPFYITKQGCNLMGIDLFDKLGFEISHEKTQTDIQNVSQSEQADVATSLQAKYPKIFSGFGKLEKYEHAPRVDTTVRPVSQPL